LAWQKSQKVKVKHGVLKFSFSFLMVNGHKKTGFVPGLQMYRKATVLPETICGIIKAF
jgi:hypothetical protein